MPLRIGFRYFHLAPRVPALGALWAGVLLAAGAFASQPPWEKPVESWTAQDVAALLNHSPWSVQTVAVMEDPADEREPQPAGPPDTGERGLGGTKARWDGEIGRNRIGHPPTLPVTLRWESALPIRQAEKDSAAPTRWYVISIAGLIPSGQYTAVGHTETSSASDGSSEAHNPEEVLEAFMASSKLSLRNGNLQPENVKLDPATGVVRIFFSRATAIDPGEKEVVFTTRFGKLSVRVKFHISSMKYHGNIEL